VKQKISIVLEVIVVTLVFLLASGSMVESYNQVFGWYKVHRDHHSHHDHHGYHGYRHYGHYGSRPFGHPGGGGYSRPSGHIGNLVNGSPSYYGHRNYGKSGPIIWHPKSPIFCHGNPIVCHPSTPISPVSPITPVTPVISHPGDNVGAESPITPSSQGDPGGSGFAGGPVGIPSF
jgi:hypothetical protein